MTYACTLPGVSLHSEESAACRCQDYIDRQTRPTDEGQKMFALLERYPTFIQQVMCAVSCYLYSCPTVA